MTPPVYVDLFGEQCHPPTIGHYERLLELDPTHPDVQPVAYRFNCTLEGVYHDERVENEERRRAKWSVVIDNDGYDGEPADYEDSYENDPDRWYSLCEDLAHEAGHPGIPPEPDYVRLDIDTVQPIFGFTFQLITP